MDPTTVRVARTCFNASHDGSMAFPDIIGALVAAGFEGYGVDYRSNTTTYYHVGGDALTLDSPEVHGHVASRFDQPALAEQIRWAQSGAADYSYAAFCANAKAAGCAGYVVSFPGKRVLYYGRTAETHVEHFPQ